LIMLVSAHDVELSAPVVVATHVELSTVVTESGNELTLRENEVDSLSEALVPNNVAVGLGLHDAILGGPDECVSLQGHQGVRNLGIGATVSLNENEDAA